MKQKIILSVTLSLFLFYTYAFDGKKEIQAELKSVTVYRSGAEMLHTANTFLQQGNNEVIIDGISNTIDENSIQVKVPSTVTILNIGFSNNYLIAENKSQHLLQLEDSLEYMKDIISKLTLSINNNTELLDVLKANREIKGEQAGLSVAELSKLMDYYQAKSLELQNSVASLLDQKNKLNEKLYKIQKQIEEEKEKNVSTAGRLTLQVAAAKEGTVNFTIAYIAKNACWTPFYDVRATNATDPLQIIYKAKIVQTTGIDWKQVKLSLSTSIPAQWGNAPSLESWFLGYIDPYASTDKTGSSLQGKVSGIQIRGASQLNDVVVVGYTASANSEVSNNYVAPKPVYIVDGNIMSEEAFQTINPNAIKNMHQIKPKEAEELYGSAAAGGATVVELRDGLEDYVNVKNNALNVVFNIDMPYDVPTNGKEQTATIQNMNVNTLYEDDAIPKSDPDVYLLAKVPGWEKLNLLPGEANIIFENNYIGKTFIDPNKTVDTLNLTMGHDKRVVITREKLSDFSSVKFLGNNKLQKFIYEITMKNNKAETVNMVLKDQFPVSTNKDIEVELLESDGAEINKDLGMLTWKITLLPGESKKIRFGYSIKYPKDKTINIE